MAYSRSGYGQIAGASQYGETYSPLGTLDVGHGQYGISEIQKESWIDPQVYRSQTPLSFIQYLCSQNSITISSTLYTHREEKARSSWDKITVALAGSPARGSESTITVSNVNLHLPGYLVYNDRTKEVMRVKAVVHASNQLKVLRAFAADTPTGKPILANDYIRIVGPAWSETQLPGKEIITRTGHINNSVQKLSQTISQSTMLKAQSMRPGGGEYYMNKRKRALYHHVDFKESICLFGRSYEVIQGVNSNLDVSLNGVNWLGTTGGLFEFLERQDENGETRAQIIDAGGRLEYEDLADILHMINRNRNMNGVQTQIQTEGGKEGKTQGGYNLVALCGWHGKKALGRIMRKNNIEIHSGMKEYGFDVQKIMTEGGQIDVFQHHKLNGSFSGHIILLDPKLIRTIKYKNHSKPGKSGVMVRDVTVRNQPGEVLELYEVFGFDAMLPECFGCIYNTIPLDVTDGDLYYG